MSYLHLVVVHGRVWKEHLRRSWSARFLLYVVSSHGYEFALIRFINKLEVFKHRSIVLVLVSTTVSGLVILNIDH